jgi:hypothetical protein
LVEGRVVARVPETEGFAGVGRHRDLDEWMGAWNICRIYGEKCTTQSVVYIKKKIAMLSPMFSFAILFLGNGDWDNLLFYPPVGTLIYMHWENGPTQGNKTRTILESRYVSRNRGEKTAQMGRSSRIR